MPGMMVFENNDANSGFFRRDVHTGMPSIVCACEYT
jgi:hypothetical protein